MPKIILLSVLDGVDNLGFRKFTAAVRRLYDYLRRFVKPAHEQQKEYNVLMIILRMLYLSKRAMFHLRFLDFSTLPGMPGYILWRVGIIRWWQRHMVSTLNSGGKI